MRKGKIYRSDFLFTNTSFLIGSGSVLNISGNYFPFNYSKSGQEADKKGIQADWQLIGQDIKKVVISKNNED